MNIKQTLTFLISLLVITSSLAVGILAIIMASQMIEQNTEEWMHNEASIGALLVASSIDNHFDILRELANTGYIRGMDWDTQYEMLFPYTQDMDIDDMAIIDLDGNARHLSGGTVNIRSRDYVQRALRGEMSLSEVISPDESAVKLDYPIMNYVVPIRSEGRVVGALLARVNALGLTDVVSNIKARGHSYAYLSNTQGRIIAHTTRPDLLMKNPIEMAKTDSTMSSIAHTTEYMISHTTGGNSQYTMNGNKMLCAFAPVGNQDMILVLTAELSSLMTEVTRLRNLIFIIVAAFVVIGLFAALKIAGFIAKRLKNVETTVTRLGGGDFSKEHKVLKKDEIGAIAAALNKCMESIKHLVKTIKEKTSSLSQIGKELSENMVRTNDAMNLIDENMVNINKRMEYQSASVIETSSTMRQMISTIRKLTDNVELQSESVSQSSSAIEQMLANIESVTQTLIRNSDGVKVLAKASDVGRSGLQEVAADIQEIARESEGLLEINAVMQNIASQTNLLSMNAAIEAAHAGDAGKGFAVVADEIRKLAESSSEQSKTISAVLKKIKESIDKITQSTNTVLNKFEDIDKGVKTVSQQEDNIRASMEEQSVGSKQILEAVGKLNDLTRQVKAGSAEMSEGSEQIIQESENLEKVTSEVTSAIKEMSSETEEISTVIKRINETTGHNKENINVLIEEVGRFKVE